MNDEPNKAGEMDDLETQLAALGMLGGDDDDGGLGALFGGEDDDPFAMLEALGEGSGSDAAPISLDGDMDIEDQLNALMKADQNADADFDLRDMSVATPTQSVYDPEVEGMGSIMYVKGTFKVEEEKAGGKLFEDISLTKILATGVIGLLVIIVGAASAIFATLAIREQQEAIAAVSHFVPIELPVNVANNANFVFINQPMNMGGNRNFTLSRISAGSTGTFFYFNEYFNPHDYIILLYNQARHLYPITTFGMQASPGSGTVLQFGSLSRNTLFMSLHIQCRRSNEYVRFEYRFLTPPVHSPSLYLSRGVYAMGDDGFSGLMIRYGTFDNTSSQIHFSFAREPGVAGLHMNPDLTGNFVSLTDLFSTINNLTNGLSAVYYEDFGITIGAANFGALLSIDGPMNVNFNALTFYYPYPAHSVTPRDLFGNNQDEPFPVQIGPFTLNLEAMAQQQNLVVFTLHGLDEIGRRREVIPNMTLRVALDNGFVDLPGDARVSPRGTDVLFDLLPYSAYLRDVPISRYSLIIHSVEFEVPQISVPLQLSTVFNDLPNARRFMAEMAVNEAFMSLLSHKSGEVTLDGVVGISDDLRANHEMLRAFAPVNLAYRPMYGSTVVTGDLVSNYDYIAIVEVQWASGNGAVARYLHETFQVTARSRDGIWAVVDFRPL